MLYKICRAILYFSVVYITLVSGIFLACNTANKPFFSGIKAECKNEGQQMQFMKIQNTNTIVTKQNTLLQEKNQTAILTRSNIQNNITSPVSYYTLQ